VKNEAHLAALDGWRGISILLVLAAHLLPLGPKAWRLNASVGVMGMAIFFTLSGFLITSFLIKRPAVSDFLMRRCFRIIPLAWLYLAIALVVAGASAETWMAHVFFYANLPPKHLVPLTDHMWSLCVEVQFYAGIAALTAILGGRGLLVLPVLCVLVTGFRIYSGTPLSTVTYFRIDEILSGCTLALLYHGRLGGWLPRRIGQIPQGMALILLFLSCLVQAEWLNYFRPYLAAALIGATIVNSQTVIARSLDGRALAYLAAISYALYVWHPLLAASWLGSGGTVEKYAKRPLLVAALLVLAHLSTYRYERRWIEFGRKLVNSFRPALR